jgi:hypothetical protein
VQRFQGHSLAVMNHMSVLVLLCALLLFLPSQCGLAADSPTDPALPLDAQKIIDDLNAVKTKAKAVYDATVSKATASDVKALDKIVHEITQKGDLDAAMTVKKVADELRKNIDHPADIPVTQDPSQAILGRWLVLYDTGFKTTLMVNADRSCRSNIPGNWKITENRIIFNFDNGTVDWYKLPISDDMVGESTACAHVHLTKLP